MEVIHQLYELDRNEQATWRHGSYRQHLVTVVPARQISLHDRCIPGSVSQWCPIVRGQVERVYEVAVVAVQSHQTTPDCLRRFVFDAKQVVNDRHDAMLAQ